MNPPITEIGTKAKRILADHYDGDTGHNTEPPESDMPERLRKKRKHIL